MLKGGQHMEHARRIMTFDWLSADGYFCPDQKWLPDSSASQPWLRVSHLFRE